MNRLFEGVIDDDVDYWDFDGEKNWQSVESLCLDDEDDDDDEDGIVWIQEGEVEEEEELD